MRGVAGCGVVCSVVGPGVGARRSRARCNGARCSIGRRVVRGVVGRSVVCGVAVRDVLVERGIALGVLGQGVVRSAMYDAPYSVRCGSARCIVVRGAVHGVLYGAV